MPEAVPQSADAPTKSYIKVEELRKFALEAEAKREQV